VKVPLLDLGAQYETIRRDLERAVAAVFADQKFILGPAVERFERDMKAYTGAAGAVALASGSDALLVALMALDVGADDAVVTTPFTFFATAGSIVRTGARLAFADIDPRTFNIDPSAAAAALREARRRSRRVVLMPVHLYGRLAPMDALLRAAAEHEAAVVEDAAQAVGARAAFGAAERQAGTFGTFGALSFFPSKNLGAAGDAGMLLCGSGDMAERARMLGNHGSRARYVHERVGVNSRLDSLQAALLSVKLMYLDRWNAARRAKAAGYRARFEAADLVPNPVVPPEEPGEVHVFHQYVIRAERRDALRDAMAKAGVASQVYYPVPLHRQPCFGSLGFRAGQFPEAERACAECLALPIYPELSDAQQDRVVEVIAAFYHGR
jgi:dTDP-4-amino-4,6-dideoxygalactose transaminase